MGGSESKATAQLYTKAWKQLDLTPNFPGWTTFKIGELIMFDPKTRVFSSLHRVLPFDNTAMEVTIPAHAEFVFDYGAKRSVKVDSKTEVNGIADVEIKVEAKANYALSITWLKVEVTELKTEAKGDLGEAFLEFLTKYSIPDNDSQSAIYAVVTGVATANDGFVVESHDNSFDFTLKGKAKLPNAPVGEISAELAVTASNTTGASTKNKGKHICGYRLEWIKRSVVDKKLKKGVKIRLSQDPLKPKGLDQAEQELDWEELAKTPLLKDMVLGVTQAELGLIDRSPERSVVAASPAGATSAPVGVAATATATPPPVGTSNPPPPSTNKP